MATRAHRYCSDQAYASILTWRTRVLPGIIDASDDVRDDPSVYTAPANSPTFGAIDATEEGALAHRSVSEIAQEEARERAAQRKSKTGGGVASTSRADNRNSAKEAHRLTQLATMIMQPEPIVRPPGPSPLVSAHPRGLPQRPQGNIKSTTYPYERAAPQVSPAKRAREEDFDSDRPDAQSPIKTYDSRADYDKTMVNPMYSSPGTVKRVRLRLSPPRTEPGTIEGPLDSPTTLPSRGTTIMPSSSGSKLRQDGAFYSMYDKFISGKGL